MRIVSIPCLSDNYAYLVICEATQRAAIVDPSEAAPVLAAVRQHGVELAAIWNTHHHWDHTGGNQELVAAVGGLEVVAHESDRGRVPAQTKFVDEGDTVSVGQVSAVIIHNPGHTSGAISYHIADPGAVFTGDTMFGAGCGRLFEGTPADMRVSLGKLSALPGATQSIRARRFGRPPGRAARLEGSVLGARASPTSRPACASTCTTPTRPGSTSTCRSTARCAG